MTKSSPIAHRKIDLELKWSFNTPPLDRQIRPGNLDAYFAFLEELKLDIQAPDKKVVYKTVFSLEN